MDQAWKDAAHLYNSLDERGRAHYWSQLSPEQQELLRNALAAVAEPEVPVPEPVQVYASPMPAAPARRSLAGTLGIGCLGMFLGAALTIGAEVAAISAGIQAVAGFFALPSSSRSEEERPVYRDENGQREDQSNSKRDQRNSKSDDPCVNQTVQ